MRNLSILFILMFCLPAQAALYKWLDENGEVVYSDEPPYEGAEQLDPPPLTTTPAVKAPPAKAKPTQEPQPPKSAAVEYKEIRLSKPADDEAVRNNAGNVTFEFVVTPALQTELGHSISLMIDGSTVKSGLQTTSVSIEHMDRGTHQVQLKIVDGKGKTLKASPVSKFHLLRYSKLFKKPAP